MRRLAITMLSLALLTASFPCRAEEASDQQNPGEYSEEDGHPLKLLSYVVAPVGFILEWTVTRPLHYIATYTPLAPVLGGEKVERSKPAPIAELPLDSFPPEEPAPTLREENLKPQASKPKTAPANPPASSALNPPAETAPPIGQPILH